MRLTASLTSKGQVTIPKSVRDFLGVDTGDKLDFQIDYENNCVHLYVHQIERTCLACRGSGWLVASQQECILCVGTGNLPVEFMPLKWLSIWQRKYDVSVETSILHDDDLTEGIYVPMTKINHPAYDGGDMQIMNDVLAIYLFLQLVAGDKNELQEGEFTLLKSLLKTSVKDRLHHVFKIEDEINDEGL